MTDSPRLLHVACGQILCRVGDLDHNLAQIDDMAGRAAARGARLILFAEGAITGYLLTAENLARAVQLASPPAKRLQTIARQHDITVVAGSIAQTEAGRHISAFIASPDGKLILQHKNKLTPKELAAKLVAGPEQRVIFEVDGVRCAISICADSGIEDLRNKLADQGVQVYLAPTAGGGGRKHMCHEADLDDPEKRTAYLESMEKVCFMGRGIAECRDHRMALVCTNLAGDDGVDSYHPGHSAIIDSRGCVMGLVPGEYVAEWLRPQLLTGDIVVQPPRRVAKTD